MIESKATLLGKIAPQVVHFLFQELSQNRNRNRHAHILKRIWIERSEIHGLRLTANVGNEDNRAAALQH